jgi:hypothetical protein
MGMGTGIVSRPIDLVGVDICRSLGYNFGSGIIILEQNPTRCHPYTHPVLPRARLCEAARVSTRYPDPPQPPPPLRSRSPATAAMRPIFAVPVPPPPPANLPLRACLLLGQILPPAPDMEP